MKNAVKIDSGRDEEHIVSVVVHIRPEFSASAEQAMDQLSGVERITEDASGRYVLIISAPSARQVMVQIEAIQEFEGVLSAAMIAHHTESAQSLNQEIELSETLLEQGRVALQEHQ